MNMNASSPFSLTNGYQPILVFTHPHHPDPLLRVHPPCLFWPLSSLISFPASASERSRARCLHERVLRRDGTAFHTGTHRAPPFSMACLGCVCTTPLSSCSSLFMGLVRVYLRVLAFRGLDACLSPISFLQLGERQQQRQAPQPSQDNPSEMSAEEQEQVHKASKPSPIVTCTPFIFLNFLLLCNFSIHMRTNYLPFLVVQSYDAGSSSPPRSPPLS